MGWIYTASIYSSPLRWEGLEIVKVQYMTIAIFPTVTTLTTGPHVARMSPVFSSFQIALMLGGHRPAIGQDGSVTCCCFEVSAFSGTRSAPTVKGRKLERTCSMVMTLLILGIFTYCGVKNHTHGYRKCEIVLKYYIEINRWWFQTFLCSSRKLGEMITFDVRIFQMGWFNHQLVLHGGWLCWYWDICIQANVMMCLFLGRFCWRTPGGSLVKSGESQTWYGWNLQKIVLWPCWIFCQLWITFKCPKFGCFFRKTCLESWMDHGPFWDSWFDENRNSTGVTQTTLVRGMAGGWWL